MILLFNDLIRQKSKVSARLIINLPLPVAKILTSLYEPLYLPLKYERKVPVTSPPLTLVRCAETIELNAKNTNKKMKSFFIGSNLLYVTKVICYILPNSFQNSK